MHSDDEGSRHPQLIWTYSTNLDGIQTSVYDSDKESESNYRNQKTCHLQHCNCISNCICTLLNGDLTFRKMSCLSKLCMGSVVSNLCMCNYSQLFSTKSLKWFWCIKRKMERSVPLCKFPELYQCTSQLQKTWSNRVDYLWLQTKHIT